MLIELDLLKYQNKLQLKTEFGKYFIGDKIRNKYVAMTPEELVRQLMIHFLIDNLHYPKSKLQVEKSLKINNMDISRYICLKDVTGIVGMGDKNIMEEVRFRLKLERNRYQFF